MVQRMLQGICRKGENEMVDNETLLAISDLLDNKLKPIYEMQRQNNERFDQIDEKFDRIDERFDRIDKKFEQIDERFEQIDARFEQIDERFEQIDERFEQIDARFEQIDKRFEQVDKRFEQVDKRLNKIDAQIAGMDGGLKNVELMIENDISPRLQNIERCYIDTYRRYAVRNEEIDALKMDNEILKKVVQEHSRKLQTLC